VCSGLKELMMQVIPVIDLLQGHVVRGIGGRRDGYRPIESRIAADSRPATVARALADGFGFRTAYVADLDAILRGAPDEESWSSIAAAGLVLWLDAGVGTAASAARVLKTLRRRGLRARVVVGLESLESEQSLPAIASLCGDQPPIFSLDLKAGVPLVRNPQWQSLSAIEMALAARAHGFRDLIVLDLADVGTGSGTRTLDLCRQIRQAAELERLIAGGGVRGIADLRAVAEAGCDAALVASALHDGRLTREVIDAEFSREAQPAAD
jgi:phosphoribosylformimino-5-aminoimidazole carboxamide ribotide isomerase